MCITFTSTGPAATFCSGSPLPHYVPEVLVAYMADRLLVALTVDIPYLRMWSRTAIAVAAVALVTACSTAVTAAPSARPHSRTLIAAAIMPGRATVVIDGARSGPVFQGIGAISGGGGNSRLLIDYPPAERGQILDYLFSPHFGASLQMLKLEIGGGGFSSDGSEPSVEAVKGRLDCGDGL